MNSVIVPNFVEITLTTAEIWRFFDFSRSWPPPSYFQIFNGQNDLGCRTAILPNFVEIAQTAAEMAIFLFLPVRRKRCARNSHHRVSVSVCLRVFVCVTRRYCIKTAKRRITQTTPRDSPGTLVFLMPKFVGGRPTFPLKFVLKVTHPLSNSTI